MKKVYLWLDFSLSDIDFRYFWFFLYVSINLNIKKWVLNSKLYSIYYFILTTPQLVSAFGNKGKKGKKRGEIEEHWYWYDIMILWVL